jgi:U3 small nucleolar RNA-associated protein 24
VLIVLSGIFSLRMGRAKSKGPKFAAVKKIITKKTIQKYKEDVLNPKKKDNEKEKLGRNVPQVSSALFFSYNTALGPPYRVIVDTNFINFSIQNKVCSLRLRIRCSSVYPLNDFVKPSLISIVSSM